MNYLNEVEPYTNDGARHDAQKLKHLINVAGVVMEDALDTWGEIWDELDGTVMQGIIVLPEAENGSRPKCGWPEFLEKLWLLRHYLDYVKRLCNGQ